MSPDGASEARKKRHVAAELKKEGKKKKQCIMGDATRRDTFKTQCGIIQSNPSPVKFCPANFRSDTSPFIQRHITMTSHCIEKGDFDLISKLET